MVVEVMTSENNKDLNEILDLRKEVCELKYRLKTTSDTLAWAVGKLNLEPPFADYRPIVIIESPYAGNVGKNIIYAIRCLKDSLDRGESPYASHLLYTLCLNDNIAEERELGIRAGLEFQRVCDKIVVYTDHGITAGMKIAIKSAKEKGLEIEYRKIL